MKTPYLDTEIQRLSMLESRDELTEWGKEMLNELKEVKEAVTNREVKKTNYSKILIQQDGAYALPEVNEKLFYYFSDEKGVMLNILGQTIETARQQALDNAVKFRDDDYKYILLFGLGVSNEIVYDCPSGFEIVIENGCKHCGCAHYSKRTQRVLTCVRCNEDWETIGYATLKNIK